MRRVRRGYPKTYNSRRPLKIILTVLVSLIAVVVIVTVTLFFSLRKYIVYDPDGTLHLEIPWLEEDMPPD